MPLPLDTNAPRPHEFCRPAFNAHIEFLSRWFRLLKGTAILQARNRIFRRHGFSGRLRVMLAGDGKRFLEVLDIEPLQSAPAFQHAVLPQAGGLDIEFALLLLIAGLDAVARDGPLSAHPIDFAMQGHFLSSFPKEA